MGKLLETLGLPPLKPAQPAIDFKMPADPKQKVDLFAAAIAKTQDAVLRDKLVRGLRDEIAKIPQPFLKPDEIKSKIDDAIKSLIESKSKELLLKLIEAAVGQKAQRMPEEGAPPHYGPRAEEKDLGERMFKISLPLPGDKPKPVVRGSFEFRELPRSAKPGTRLSFKLLTPHWFHPEAPFSYVVVMNADDFAKDKRGARNLGDAHIETAGPIALSITMPDAPGRYVLAVKYGPDFQGDPVEPIEVKP